MKRITSKEMKEPEEMTFAELSEYGLLSYYGVRNYRIWKALKAARESGLNHLLAFEKVGEQFFMSASNVATCVRNAWNRKRKANDQRRSD